MASAAASSSTARSRSARSSPWSRLLLRLYGPVNQLSTMQINVLTALVSFDRVFEVLDLKPLISGTAAALPRCPPAEPGTGGRRTIEFDRVSFPVPDRQRGIAGLAGVDRAAHAGTH